MRVALVALALAACSAGAAPPATVADAFPPPPGAERATATGFGASLRALTVREAGVPVRTFDGRVVGHHARVIELPLVKGDLQQCADSALRLRAEYLRDHDLPVVFHATSGDAMPWARYRDGERARAEGRGLVWGPAEPASWDRYLRDLFTWAGTRSLQAYDTLPDDHPDPGDVLVEGGSPGHAVVLLDVARRGDTTWLLLGEGFMPAQDFHVELGPDAGWWRWDPQEGVTLPAWRFGPTALRAWR